MLEANRDWDEKQKHQGEGARRGFEHAPDYQSPRTACQVLQHKQGETADGDPSPENKSDEIAMKEMTRTKHRSKHKRERKQQSNRERDVARSIQVCRSCVTANHLNQPQMNTDMD